MRCAPACGRCEGPLTESTSSIKAEKSAVRQWVSAEWVRTEKWHCSGVAIWHVFSFRLPEQDFVYAPFRKINFDIYMVILVPSRVSSVRRIRYRGVVIHQI